MSKPDDIPQDIWESSAKPSLLMLTAVKTKTIEELEVVQGFYQRSIARAILAERNRHSMLAPASDGWGTRILFGETIKVKVD